jgi:hypothetical protein
MAQVWHTRLNHRDVERLSGCLPKLDAVYDAVKATGLGGKASLMQQCQEVFDTIHELLVRDLAYVTRQKENHQRTAARPGGEEATSVLGGDGARSGAPGAQEES